MGCTRPDTPLTDPDAFRTAMRRYSQLGGVVNEASVIVIRSTVEQWAVTAQDFEAGLIAAHSQNEYPTLPWGTVLKTILERRSNFPCKLLSRDEAIDHAKQRGMSFSEVHYVRKTHNGEIFYTPKFS